MIKVMYDGWHLVWGPNSPEALHLLSLLQQRHPQVEALVALPDQPPPWLPDGVAAYVQPATDTPRARLVWEQHSLPRLAASLGADLLHLTTCHPPLLGRAASVVSPAEFPSAKSLSGFSSRLRQALASGGMARLGGLLWPSDLSAVPPPKKSTPVYHLPFDPLPDAGMIPDQEISKLEALNLPESYILYHGPGDIRSLRRLLGAWSWAAGAIGEYYPLLILGIDFEARQGLQVLLAEWAIQDVVRPMPVIHPGMVPLLYQGCSAVFHPAPLSAWGVTARLSLTYSKPLVAAESLLVDALAGPAAYLLPEQDARGLGAGLITVVVEQQVSQALSQAGVLRAAAWDQRSFRDTLFAAYQSILTAG